LKVSPVTALQVFVCGALGAALANLYLVSVMKASASRFRTNEFARTNLRWIPHLPGLGTILGKRTLEYLRTRTVLFPFLELACGAALMISADANGIGPAFIRDIAYLLFALGLSVINWQGGDMLLPDAWTFPAIGVGLIMNTLTAPSWSRGLRDGLLGCAAGYLFIRLIADFYYYVLKREGMGLGVAKWFAAIGAFYGWTVLPAAMFGASLIGFLIGFPASVVARRRGEISGALTHVQMPFGHFLAIAGFLAGVLQPVWLPAVKWGAK